MADMDNEAPPAAEPAAGAAVVYDAAPQETVADVETPNKPAPTSTTEDGTQSAICCATRRQKIIWGVLCFVILVVIILFIVWIATRPENIDLTEAADSDSPLEFVKAGMTGSGLTLSVSMSFRTANTSNVSYWIDVTGGFPADATPPIDWYFVASVDDAVAEDGTSFVGADALAPAVYRVEEVNNATALPFRLSPDFVPDTYSGGVFVDATNAIVGGGPVSFDVDTGNSKPQVLVSQLGGVSGYSTSGSIILGIRSTLVDGQVEETPYMILNDIRPPRAPGPFLYLSDDSRWSRDDLFLPLDDVQGGSFTKTGSFVQDINQPVDFEQFMNGYFLVWCRPFSVLLGRGSIALEDDPNA